VKCRACGQTLPPKRVMEDKSANGVRVHVYRFANGGTTVDASCQCFGHTGRVHSNDRCPVLLRAQKEAR
jgi:hypothetical protein